MLPLRLLIFLALGVNVLAAGPGNRLAYLDEDDPFYVDGNFPKLTTPQWVGEKGVEAVVVMAIDDMRETSRYETYLRPVLDRLKKIDGRAPLSIFCNALDPSHPHLQDWLKEGLSLEVHTLAHPCPFLARSNFVAAANTYHQCVDLIDRIQGNKAVAFRMPCCDSINSPSPRFYAEIFNKLSASNQFLTIDSSVMNIPTAADASLPKEWAADADGKEKFRKYLPFPSFVTTIENYPYPYVIGKLCWEFPPMVPSDWEAQHLHGTNNPVTVQDWKTGLDIVVQKKGVFTFIFHPHGWIKPEQLVEFIDYAAEKYGSRVKFLNFREAEKRLNENLLAGQSLRQADGTDNGVRLVDLNDDGLLDVLCGNESAKFTRVWDAASAQWKQSAQPFESKAVRLGVLEDGKVVFALQKDEGGNHAWSWKDGQWKEDARLLKGIENVSVRAAGKDKGVRVRDLNNDGEPELIASNPDQNVVLSFSSAEGLWKKLPYALPKNTALVDSEGRDEGVRFVDLNGDGYADLVQSNERRYSVNLFVPKLVLGFQPGFSREVIVGAREQGEIPMITRGGEHPNNGAWFHSGHLWVQNEETAHMADLVDRRSFGKLLAGAQPKAKSPEEALRSFRVRPGFKVELVAVEPLTMDPVAFEWDHLGRLWIVEMGDYPQGLDGHGAPGGVVRFLEDTDGDGNYDKATVFMDHVNFPNGIYPWGKGVIVSAAPEIFYAEDRDGDGRADYKKVLLTGFVQGNQQHRINGFDYGLDGWLYAANGDSGGTIGVPNQERRADLRGHDLSFDPNTLGFETIEGQTQFGRHRDDWGNWFGNNNPAWLWHYHLPESYLRRNSYLPVRSSKHYLANYPDSTRAFPTSRQVQRYNDIGNAGHVTSANSAAPYRDDLFGDDFKSTVFVSEPVHNLIHREVLSDDGVTFSSRRAAGEEKSEFLSSSDNWFRCTMVKTGPDGALYIADMYRFVIEHPEWIPADTQKQLDLRAGSDKGRIYRVVPEGKPLRKIAVFAGKSTEEVARLLESPNGWTRDTAQRLLLEKRDTAAVPVVRDLALKHPSPKTRLQALSVLQGLGAAAPELLEKSLKDENATVRRQALKFSEKHLAQPELLAAARRMAGDPDAKVRMQLAFSLGETKDPAAAEVLAELARRDWGDETMQVAILSSALPHLPVLTRSLLANAASSGPALSALGRLALRAGDHPALSAMVKAACSQGSLENWQLEMLASVFQEARRMNLPMKELESKAGAQPQLPEVFPKVRRELAVAKNERAARLVTLAGFDPDKKAASEALVPMLKKPEARELQPELIGALRNVTRPELAAELLKDWKELGPNARSQVLGLLASRRDWTGTLLEAVQKGTIAPGEVPPNLQEGFLNSNDEGTRSAARGLFRRESDRQKLVEKFAGAIERTGDAKKGAALFAQHCATCHKLRGQGNELGPDLASVMDKPDKVLLESILDPNRSFEARYESYDALLKNGTQVSGIITSESGSSVTIKNAGGLEATILRGDLESLRSSGRSLMPEGFETSLTEQDFADLLAGLRAY